MFLSEMEVVLRIVREFKNLSQSEIRIYFFFLSSLFILYSNNGIFILEQLNAYP